MILTLKQVSCEAVGNTAYKVELESGEEIAIVSVVAFEETFKYDVNFLSEGDYLDELRDEIIGAIQEKRTKIEVNFIRIERNLSQKPKRGR
jgi:hypothetical protein